MFIIYFILYLLIGHGVMWVMGRIVRKTVDKDTVSYVMDEANEFVHRNGTVKMLILTYIAWPVMLPISMYGWYKANKQR